MAGAAIYLALPSLIAVLGAWPRLSTLNSAWFALALVAELVSFTCNFALQLTPFSLLGVGGLLALPCSRCPPSWTACRSVPG